MKNLIETVRSLNDGLESIAPPPPEYSAALCGPSTIPSISQVLSNSSVSQSVTPTTRRQDNSSTRATASIPTTQETEPVFERLYMQCLQVFSAVIYRLPSDNLDCDYALKRFRLWGVNLFEGDIGLDRMMVNLFRKSLQLQNFLLGTFGDIILTLGKYLTIHCKVFIVYTNFLRLDPLVRYVISLGHRNMEVEHSKLMALFADENLAGATSANSPYFDFLEEDRVERQVTELITQCKTQLEGLVECLFEVLPAIRRFREIYFLEMERQSRDIIRISDETTESTTTQSSAGKVKEPCSKDQEDGSLDLLNLDLQLATAIQESLLDEEARRMGESKHSEEIEKWKEEISKLDALKGLMSAWSSQTLTPKQKELKEEVFQDFKAVARTFGMSLARVSVHLCIAL